MRTVTTCAAMQRLALAAKRRGQRIGFVPTMGFLHAGHTSLMERARRAAGPDGLVVASIYVNPAQFAPHEDLAKYPRDLPGDKQRCAAAGVDILFAPKEGEMYADRPAHSTYCVEEEVSQGMEGRARPSHFRGVATVVAKLFNLVLPDFAVFGAKDFQQAAVIRRMIRDLNFPVRLMVAPTVREPDGLAMSSRNKYLSPAERSDALALHRALQQARRAVRAGGTVSAASLAATLRRTIQQAESARIDYIEFFDPTSLAPVRTVARGTQLALAVYIGKTRLIDNAAL